MNSSCDGLEHLERARLGPARGVDDELREHLALDVGRPQHVGIARRRSARDRRDLLLDLELEVRLVVLTGAVPPTTPLAIPPATPLPEKSASSVTFLDRSMSGSTSGILTGAVSTWNPFGGGGATTTSFGGGWLLLRRRRLLLLLHLDELDLLGLGLLELSLACSVPYTAAVPRIACMTPLKMRPPVVRCFLGFDSIRLLNMSAQTYVVRGRDTFVTRCNLFT